MSSSGQYTWCGLGSSTCVSAAIVASRNQGNALNETNRSFSPISNQNPWGEILVTSTAEVLFPRCADCILMLLDNPEGCVDPTAGQSVILRQLQPGLQPELCFAAGVLDVHVAPWLFAGEKVEAIAPNSQDGRTHDSGISRLPTTSPSDL